MKFEVTNFCEIDKYAVESYCRIHDEDVEKNLGDITGVNTSDIKDCNVIVGGSPCFTKDTLVLTSNGYKEIQDIKIGDSVLSHDGKYHIVTQKLNQGIKLITKITSPYFTTIHTTQNHRFYAKKRTGLPQWVEAQRLCDDDYLGCYIGDDGVSHNYPNNELYAYGLYLRFGIEDELDTKTLTLKIPSCYQEDLRKKLHHHKVGFSFSVQQNNPDFVFVSLYFGKYQFSNNLLSLSRKQASVMLEGACAFENGHCISFDRTQKNTLYTISYLFMKSYQKPCTCTFKRNRYTLWFDYNMNDYFVENDYLWYPVTVSRTADMEMVFDLTVDDAHSFVAQHCIAHNCQDFSVAGKRKGALWTCKDCGHAYNPLEVHYTQRDCCPKCKSQNLERTRSSLIVEYLRMIRDKKPSFAVYENVKNLVGKDFKLLFDAFLEELNEYGYNTYYEVLNAKHFGIPQNRERVILVIIKKDLDNGQFKFPSPFDSGLRLIHVLENTVPQKYYVDNEKAGTLLKTLSKEAVESLSDTTSPVFTEIRNNIESAVENNESAVLQNRVCVASRGRYKENPNLRISGLPTEQRLEPNLNGTVNTLTSVQKDNLVLEQEIIVDEGIKPCVRKNFEREKQQVAESDKEIYQCKCDSGWQDNKIGIKVSPTLRANNPFTCVYANCCIRRLTPLECFRLMGFDDIDFQKAQQGKTIMSDTQLYKQAGNSIVTNVLYYTYVNLYQAMPYLFDDVKLLSLFSGIGAFEKAFKMLQCYIDNPQYVPNDYLPTLTENKPLRVGQVSSDGSQAGTVYSDKNIAPTICAGTHGYAMGYIYTENFPKPPTN